MKLLNNIMMDHVKRQAYPGMQWIIEIKSKIYKDKVGYMNIENRQTIMDNSIYRIWSMTKPIVSVAIMQLVEESKLSLDDPVSKFLPIFSKLRVLKKDANSIKDTIESECQPTISNLLNHTAGFSYGFLGDTVGNAYEEARLFHSDETSLEEEINNLANFPLLFQPNTSWNYSVATDVLGRILEVLYNNNLREILLNKIICPLEMIDTDFYVPKNKVKRLMISYEYDILQKKLTELTKYHHQDKKASSFGYPINKPTTYARGGHGLFSTANDYFLFSKMLLTGKTSNGQKIISRKSLELMTTNHINKKILPLKIKHVEDKDPSNDLEPYGFGLGFRVLVDLGKSNYLGSINEFGWGGAASTYFLVDPKEEIIAVLMSQVVNSDNKMKNDFINILYGSLE